MIKILALGLTRVPRIVLLGLIALKFGVNDGTDSFFLIYSIVLFLVANISFTAEIFSPNKKTLFIGVLCSSLCLLTLAIITGSTLAFLFVPYVLLSGMVSVIIGVSNLNRDYRVLAYTSIPYVIVIVPIVVTDINILGLIITLSAVELTRLIISYPVFRAPQRSSSYSWQHAVGMLMAVAIGASSGVIDKLFASTLTTGSITLLAYSYGVIFPLTNVLTYGVNAARIVNPNVRISLTPSILSTVAVVLVALGVILVSGGWASQVSGLIILLCPFIILNTLASGLRSSIVHYGDWRAILFSSILFAVCDITLDYLLLGFGIKGIVVATLASQAVYIYYLHKLLKQQKYLSYNTVMS